MQRPSQHLRSERDDLHEALAAQFADNRAEDTRADRLFVLVHENRGIAVETDHAAIGTADILAGTHDHRTVNVTLFHTRTRLGFLYGNHDHVPDTREPALRAAQYLDALDALGAAIVRDVEIGLHLDHRSGSFSLACRDTQNRLGPGSS
ncbi:conserved hypothetical protein [Erythrobacter sp. EC-HK427]|nr:conserved hypothetical protein [Erythrobacter sp. EC-HK427]